VSKNEQDMTSKCTSPELRFMLEMYKFLLLWSKQLA